MTKHDIRRQVRQSWRDLSSSGIIPDFAGFWGEVELREEFSRARTVLIYMGIHGEIPTEEVIQRWCGSKRMAVPRVAGEKLELRLYEAGKLVPGYRGIMEPSDDAEIIPAGEIDLAIVPGMAFSRDGDSVLRLGRGGGFYDRLLPDLDCPKIGVCLDFQVYDYLPVDEWDASLDDLIVCPSGQ